MNQIHITNLEESNFKKCSISNEPISLETLSNNYLNYVLTYNSSDTYKCYQGHLRIIIDFFKLKYKVNYDLDITKEMLFDFIKESREKKLTSATINKRLNVFKRSLKYSKSINLLGDVKSVKENTVTFEYLRNNEIDDLLNYVDNSLMTIRNKLIIFLFLESGVRRKELRKIKVRNIDFEEKIVFLDYTKTNDSRFVLYDHYTAKYLKLYLEKNSCSNEYLFDISNYAIDSIFKRIKKKLNFNKFSPYVLRHTYATIIVNNDGNIEMLRNTMGHRKLSTTSRYIHYNKKLLRSSYEKSFNYGK